MAVSKARALGSGFGFGFCQVLRLSCHGVIGVARDGN